MIERPDGSQATAIGWTLIAAGLLAIFFAAGAETFEGMVWGALVANLGIGLGIILLSLGYLVKAIWFLPGREIEDDNKEGLINSSPPSTAAWEDCEWCNLRVYGPARPCSLQGEEELRNELNSITEPLHRDCHSELVSRGIIEE